MKTAVSADSAGLEISPELIELAMSYNNIIIIIVVGNNFCDKNLIG